MRLKNVKGASLVIENSNYVIKDPKSFRGNFKNLFGNDNPIHVEIGMGKGQFIIGMAKAFPLVNFIGVEMYDSVIVRAVQKQDVLGLPNLKFIKIDATCIDEVFDREVDVLYLNFSDPWPKNRHEHRRLTSERFLKRYDSIFSCENIIVQKTDNRGLFEFSLRSFVDYGYRIDDISLNLHDDARFNVKTEYEERFSEMGYPIYMVKVIK